MAMVTARNELITYPKISIITCVYNGEKYISKLFDSILNMGYPNIEHIVINDGSSDSTEDIINKYTFLYQNKNEAKLYIKCIKQNNMGLGNATNTGLKHITGEYWTWINCDDWYTKNAFFEPIKLLIQKPKIDFVYMNGFSTKENTNNKETIFQYKKGDCLLNSRKTYLNFCKGVHFKMLLFICRTSSYKKLCGSMQIAPSKFTQDIQFIVQLIPNLKGYYCNNPKWFFLVRNDSLLSIVKYNLEDELFDIIKGSIQLLNIDNSKKNNDFYLFLEKNYIKNIKIAAKNKKPSFVKDYLHKLSLIRKKLFLKNRIFTSHFLFIYYIYSLI